MILDFDISYNNAIVRKEVGLELGESIINKPIVANYIPVEEINTNTDNFTGHEATIGTNKHGKPIIKTNTVPIGVFTTKGYIMTINENGVDKEVLAADAVLWRSRFSDACELLVDWYNRGIKINTSCEFLYSNFSMQDKVEYINSPVWFEGHAVLASEQRGDQGVILPAYDSSQLLSLNEINQFNKMVAQAHSFNNHENILEGEEMKFKKMFQLSHDDIRTKIYQTIDPTLPEDTYSWIREVYDDYFIIQIEGSEYKIYQYSYSKNDDSITVDFESKAEVTEKSEWVKVENEFQTQINELQNELSQTNTTLNSVKEDLLSAKNEKEVLAAQFNDSSNKLSAITEEKEAVSQKFNEATEKLTALSEEVGLLKTYKEQLDEVNYSNSLNEKNEYYKAKFSAFSALEKFETEDVQNLIKTYALNNQDSDNAKTQLNSILVDLVEVKNDLKDINFENQYVREMSSRMENLIPTDTDFDRKYT